ncbi:MAG: AAA family ATPase [Deltaproteobacteria bacterium]|nr:AAA family ATPase [Deltaproteobacteria bacterium]
MFCDLVGATALSAQLDPEDLRDVVWSYQQTCAAVIEHYEGHIAQYLGDGLLVYFGYPVAHEDDAARAVRAGLAIIAALQERVPSPLVGEGQGEGAVGARHAVPLRVRIGIHTGPVVMGEMGGGAKREHLALGETPNIAARIQGQAAPDEVLISAATSRLVEDLFECEERGQSTLKGVAPPLTLYRVLKEGDARSRFQAAVRTGLTPLVGREHELGLLRECWERATQAAGQVVVLSGEPGIGKSRLVEALKETVEHEGARCFELRCSPYHQNSALAPAIEHLQQVLGFQRDESPKEKLRKLAAAWKGRGEVTSPLQAETVALLASLLSLPHPDGHPVLTLSPQKQKEKTLAALVSWLLEETGQAPVCCVWEDLHWADPSTLELLTLFVAQVPTTRLLAVLTFRLEFTPPWGAHSYLSQLTLSRLGCRHVETMVEQVTGGKDLPKEIVQQIVAKTDGVPLFVEELTKSVVESVGAQHAAPLHLGIPATLQDALMARLDRLGPAKEIAQLGATIGREFSYELLHAVSPLNEETLQHGLQQLVATELVYQRGLTPQASYIFKHALIQDTAYQSLLKSRRQQLHQQIAHVLEERFPETKEAQPELLAHHYTEAGLVEQAIPYWQNAGQRAVSRSAHAEAVSHLTRGLAVLKTLADTPERTLQELALQTMLGQVFVATKGFTAPEVERAYARARELCRQVGDTPQLVPVLWGLAELYRVRGELQTALEVAEQLLRLAQHGQDPVSLVLAHLACGTTLYLRGALVPALEHLEQAMALYNPTQHHAQAGLALHDAGVHCRCVAAATLWYLGYPDKARQRMREASTLAQGLAHSVTLAAAATRAWATSVYQLRREVQDIHEQAEALMAFATKQGLPYYMAVGMMWQGWFRVQQGEGEAGIGQLRHGLTLYQATGARLYTAIRLGLLAEAYSKVGQAEEGLAVLAEALTMIDRTEERYHEAELYRLKGELTLQQWKVESGKSPTPSTQAEAEAETCFLKAIDIAQKQQAKSLELRAVMSLARLWQQQGKHHAARNMLAEIYGWFTEGFDTKDLQEAKALVEELA